MPSESKTVPTPAAIAEAVRSESPEHLVREVFAAACERGEVGSTSTLLVAGAVSDLLLGDRKRVPVVIEASSLAAPAGARPSAPNVAPTAAEARDLTAQVLSATWSYLGGMAVRTLPTKWLRQLPREDQPFLFLRNLDEVMAASTLEDAVLRFSAVLRVAQESSARDELLLEAAAWTRGSSALAVVFTALSALRDLPAEESRPFLIRILEVIHRFRAPIPLRVPEDPPAISWDRLAASWPHDPGRRMRAWVDRPRWSRALEVTGAKAGSLSWALDRTLVDLAIAEERESHERDEPPTRPDRDTASPPSSTVSTREELAGDLWLEWRREEASGRVDRVLAALRAGEPLPFLSLVSFCRNRHRFAEVDPMLTEGRLLAWDGLP